MNKTIFIKAEANPAIGGGHLHRCLALAKVLTETHKTNVEFIFSETSEHLMKKAAENFKIHIIEKNNQHNSSAYLSIISPESLIIFDTDNPAFYSGELINNLQKNNIKTACFTISDKNKIDTDILINMNIVAFKHNYKTSNKTLKLLGPQYLMFNPVFWKNIPFKIHNSYKNLLIFFGNADPNGLTKKTTDNLSIFEKYFDEITVIIGNLNKDKEIIKNQTTKNNKVKVLNNISPEEIFEIYKNTDVAICSAGMTMWEMALFEIKQIIIPASQREIEYSEYLNELNFVCSPFNFQNLPSDNNLKKIFEKIFENNFLNNLKTGDFKNNINPMGIKKLANTILNYMN